VPSIDAAGTIPSRHWVRAICAVSAALYHHHHDHHPPGRALPPRTHLGQLRADLVSSAGVQGQEQEGLRPGVVMPQRQERLQRQRRRLRRWGPQLRGPVAPGGHHPGDRPLLGVVTRRQLVR
jgi:hypothetical protein